MKAPRARAPLRKAKLEPVSPPAKLSPETKSPWPASAIELRSLDSLKPYEKNARTHPPEQIAQIVASMEQFGFTIPVLVDETGLLIAGHGRVLAARILARERGNAAFSQVPVMVARGWTDAQRRAYTIIDNRLNEASAWDLDLLRGELGDLRELDFNPRLLGFEGFLDPGGSLDQLAEWRGMPGYHHEDQTGFHMAVVHFKDQAALDRFAKLVGQPMTTATKYIWFPDPEPKFVSKDKRYKAKK